MNSPSAPAPTGGYAQAVELEGVTRWFFVSGQIPVRSDGTVPATFTEQCHLVWANVIAVLGAAGMTPYNLVKVTTFLGTRAHVDENSSIRRKVLRDHSPALTVIIAGIYDTAWLLEIEAIAAS